MKACVIQPPYSLDLSLSDEYFAKKLEYLAACDESMDLIVLPEYSDVPCAAVTREDNMMYHHKYIDTLLSACAETAKRCQAVVFVNALYETETGYRNTTYAFNKQGEVVGRYYKKHLPPSELYTLALDQDYTREFSEPYVLELDGIRYYIYSYGHHRSAGYRTYDNKFSYATKQLSLHMDGRMKIGEKKQVPFERFSARAGVKVSAPMRLGNLALMYYYPIVDNQLYYRQQLDEEFAEAILSPLRARVRGMNNREAVAWLLDLVQHGFDYVTDDEAFGRQKQLFIEESFFFGRNNCKDRVGVFSYLVKELVGLPVIAVRFKGNAESNGVAHIACAVAFDEEVAGDSFMHRGRRYVMCDPTYINATIGQTMPCYAASPGVIVAL